MISCPTCKSQNVFIQRAIPAKSICRDCAQDFVHDVSDCPPAKELTALVAEQIKNGTYERGLRDGDAIKRYVSWEYVDEAGLALPIEPAQLYQKIYNMSTLARFGGHGLKVVPVQPAEVPAKLPPATLTIIPAAPVQAAAPAEKPKRKPAPAKKKPAARHPT